jgi:beta-mannosidase
LKISSLSEGVTVTKEVTLSRGLNKALIKFRIEKPRLWYPNGLGKPFLYKFVGQLFYGNNVLDTDTLRTGLRTLKLAQKKDSLGKSFYFEINGIPLFAKGANYIPQDMFLNRPTKGNYEYIITQAKNANMNMLRVWGGGIYEKNYFYDLCDENGILVWQDFMFACSMYPGDKEFLENVRQEAIQNVKRLRNHPCIALWCGNNEVHLGWRDWGWTKQYSHNDSVKIYEAYKNLFEKIPCNLITYTIIA